VRPQLLLNDYYAVSWLTTVLLVLPYKASVRKHVLNDLPIIPIIQYVVRSIDDAGPVHDDNR
jgi:hypothetical protein